MKLMRNSGTRILLIVSLSTVALCIVPFAQRGIVVPEKEIAILAAYSPAGTLMGVQKVAQPEKLSLEMERLKFYIGDWAYSEDYPKSTLFPGGGHNDGYWTAQIGPRGLSIVHTFESRGTAENYEGMEIMTWDSKGKLYRDHSLWFDSPEQWSYTGQFQGDVLIYRAEFDYMGKHLQFRSETRALPAGGFTLDEFAKVNGGPEETLLHGRATRH